MRQITWDLSFFGHAMDRVNGTSFDNNMINEKCSKGKKKGRNNVGTD